MSARWKFQIALIAVIAVFAVLAGAFRDGPVAHAHHGEDRDYVDVSLTLEVPEDPQSSGTHEVHIIVVNHGTRTAYDVVVEVDVETLKPLGQTESQIQSLFTLEGIGTRAVRVPVGRISVDGTSFRWTIPELRGMQRVVVIPRVRHFGGSGVYNNRLKVHKISGTVSTASFQSDTHKENDSSQVWTYAHNTRNIYFIQVWVAYTVSVSVDNRFPDRGDTVNFTVTAGRKPTYPRVRPSPEVPPPIDLKVEIATTDGLTVGTPSRYYTSNEGGFQTTVSSPKWSYSNGEFNIGTGVAGEDEVRAHSVILPVTVGSDTDVVVNEQCLTATLTGNPPPGTGPLDDDISDNVAKVCLGPGPATLFQDGTVAVWTLKACRGDVPTNACDTVPEVDVEVLTSIDGNIHHVSPIIHVKDEPGRVFDADNGSVTDGTTVSWQTATDEDPDFTGTRNGVKVGQNLFPINKYLSNWQHFQVTFTATGLDGGNPPGKVSVRSRATGTALWPLHSSNSWRSKRSTQYRLSDPSTVTNIRFLEFEKLGTYVVDYTGDLLHATIDADSDSNPDVFSGTGRTIFHVGPIAELSVSDGGASLDATSSQVAFTVVVVNNGPEDAESGQVVVELPAGTTGLTTFPAETGTFDSTANPPTWTWDIRDLERGHRRRSKGLSESVSLIVDGVSAGETATAKVVYDPYLVCIGSNASTLTHTTEAACVADTTNGGSWHEGTVYDYNADNNEATLTAAAGVSGSTPASVTVMDPDASGVLVQWETVEQVNGLKVTHYELERPSDPWTMTTAPGDVTETKYQDKGATGSANPVYRVRAVNEAGVAGPWSQTSGMRPGAPQSFAAAVASGNAQVNLTWSAPTAVTGVTVSGYEIEVSDSGGDSWTSLETSHSASPYAHTGLSLMPGDARDYRIRTVATVGGVTLNSLWATATATVAYPKPNVPTMFTATGSSATQATLSWVHPADVTNVTRTGYEAEFSKDGGVNWDPLTGSPTGSATTTLPHTDTSLGANAVRQYRIRTTGTVGSGSAQVTVESDWAYALASEEYPAPGAPRNFMATVDSDTSVTLTWTDPEAVADVTLTGYVLEVSFDRGANWSSVATESTLGAGATTHTHTDASNPLSSKPRQYRLKAKGTVGASTYESGWVFAIPPGEVGPPRNLYAAHDPESPAASKTRINLTWDEPAFGADMVTGYRIDHAPAESGPWETLQHSRASRSYQHTGRQPGERSCYRVAAIFAGGTGPFADSVCTTTLGNPADDLPGAPEGLRIDSVGSNYVTLEWDAPSLGGAVDYYEYQSHAHAPTRVPGAATRVTVRGLQPGTSYEFQVRAVNNIGAGGWSRPIQFTLNRAGGAVKATPTELEVPKGGTGSFRVSLNRNPRWPLALYTHWEGPDCLTDWLPYQQGRILLPSGNPPPGKAFWDDGWWGPPDDRFAEPWNVGHDIELDASECQGGETAVVEYSLHSLPFSALEGVPMWEELGLSEEEWREKWGVDPMDGISGPSVKVTVVDGAGSGRTSAGEQGLASVNAGGTAVNVSTNLPPQATVWRREERGLYGSQLAWDWWD